MAKIGYSKIIDVRMDSVNSELTEIDAQIEKLQQRKPVLIGKLEELQAVKEAAGHEESSENKEPHQHSNGLLRPAKAIEQLLSENPNGLKSPEIAAAIIDKINSKSKNKRAIIQSTLYTMRTAHQITKTKSGVFRLKSDP